MNMVKEVPISTTQLPEPIDIFSARGSYEFTFPTPALEDPRVTAPVGGVPFSFLETYANLAVRHANVEQIEEGRWFAEVKGLSGAWGDGSTPEEAKEELRDAVIGWAALKIGSGFIVPVLAGFDVNPGRQREQTS